MITVEMAQQIAERALRERIAQSPVFSHYEYGAARLQEENDSFRVFLVFSEAAFNDGVMPPTLHVCVANANGRILSAEEQEQFYSQPAPPIARVA